MATTSPLRRVDQKTPAAENASLEKSLVGEQEQVDAAVEKGLVRKYDLIILPALGKFTPSQ